MNRMILPSVVFLSTSAIIAGTFVLYFKNRVDVQVPVQSSQQSVQETVSTSTETSLETVAVTEKDFLGHWMILEDITAGDSYSIEDGVYVYRSTYEGVTSVGTWSFNPETKMVTAEYAMSVIEAESATVTLLVEFDPVNKELIVRDEEAESRWVRSPALLE